MNKKSAIIVGTIGALVLSAGTFLFGYSQGIDGYEDYGDLREENAKLEQSNKILAALDEED